MPRAPLPTSIQSEEQANSALAELASLSGLRADAQTKRDRVVAFADRRCQEKLFVEIGGERQPIADRAKFLEAELSAFCWNNKDALFADPKSKELNAGRLGFRLSKPTVEEIEKAKDDKKSGWDLVREKIRDVLLRALGRTRLGAGKAAGSLFSLSVSPNKTSMLSALKSKTITHQQLAKLGFKFKPETDVFFFELEQKEIQSHSSAAPAAPAASREADG
jgi:hypothetical protein